MDEEFLADNEDEDDEDIIDEGPDDCDEDDIEVDLDQPGISTEVSRLMELRECEYRKSVSPVSMGALREFARRRQNHSIRSFLV